MLRYNSGTTNLSSVSQGFCKLTWKRDQDTLCQAGLKPQ